MRIKPKYRVLCLILLSAVIIGGLGYLYTRGDWWFRWYQQLRFYPDLALQEYEINDSDAHCWSVEELKQAEGVVSSNLLMLVSAAHPLPKDYVAVLEEYNGARMHPEMVSPYIALRDAVQARTGVRIYVSSDYRTSEEQSQIIQESEAGIAAPIGCSEHEAGLALDVYAPYYAGEDFLRSRAGREVNRICAEYGFLIRYPAGKEEVTGFSYEPWHVRYVGVPHAKLMTDAGITLEEYIAALKTDVWYSYENYLILRTASESVTLPNDWETCTLSSDNTGATVITLQIS